YLEVARILEQSGVAAIAVHGRTRAQQYSGLADWRAIGEVKATVSVPVIGNGDVRRPADIDRMRGVTGCDGVMIGRGALGNPWIFAGRLLEEVTYPERLAVIRRHALWMSSYYGEAMGIVLFRKHVVRYVQGLHDATSVRPALLAADTAGELFRALEAWSPAPVTGESSEELSEGEGWHED
ncbi:MAG: tRNA dihydrouridine synthase, partial [Anaerolineae bacterium]